MKRVVAKGDGWFANLTADKLDYDRQNSIAVAYDNGEIIGVFNLGAVESVYLNDVGGENNEKK